MAADVRILLATLSFRTSKAGKVYAVGFLGKTRLLGFPGELDRYGNKTLDLYVVPAEPKPEQPRRGPATLEGEVLAPDRKLEWSDR